MTRNSTNVPYRRKDFTAAIHVARRSQQLQTKRAIYAAIAFALSCASVIPFSAGFPLHGYWGNFGKYLVLISMGLLVPCVVLIGIALQTWLNVRNMEKD